MRKLFLLLVSVLFSLYVAADVEIRSEHLTTSNGISNNSVRCMYQDSKGFIWMGTLNGLSRYDGNSFVTYRPSQKGGIALGDHRIRDLVEDKNGFLWIATSAEVYSCYDLQRECFVDFTGCGEYRELYSDKIIDRNGNVWLWLNGNGCRKVTYADGQFSSIVFKTEKNNLPSNKVTYVYEDLQGGVWIGTDNGVVQVIGDRTVLVVPSHRASKIISDEGNLFFLSADGRFVVKKREEECKYVARLQESGIRIDEDLRIQDDWVIFTNKGCYVFNLKTFELRKSTLLDVQNGQVQKDNRGNYWVFNHTGKVWYLDTKTRAVKSFQLIPSDRVNYIDEERYHVVWDSRDLIWISTYGNGLFVYDPTHDVLQHFTADMSGFSHVASNYLLYLIEDRTGGIWVSTEYAGVSHLLVLNEGADRVFPEKGSWDGRANTVKMINRMVGGSIWLGTRQGGLYVYDQSSRTLEKRGFYDSNVYAVAEGADGSLWLGTRGNGLSVDGKWYRNTSEDAFSLGSNSIFAMLRDKKDRMWVGTFGGGLNLAVPDEAGDGYHFRRFFTDTYSQRQIRVICEEPNGYLWVGSSAGIFIFHPDSLLQDPQNYVAYNIDNGALRSNEIKCMLRDSKGRMWLGTSGKGFSMCRPEGNYKDLDFVHFDVSDGLVNSMVQSIVEDRNGKLWIATELGLSCFDPDSYTFENFFFSSYILGNAYSENSCAVADDGTLLFGSNYGLVVVDPAVVVGNTQASPMVSFTNLHVNGIAVRPGDVDSPLEHAMIYTDKIELKHYQNSFVIDFSTFEYSMVNDIKYTYRLDNYDREWSALSSLNFAAYKNLDPGHYTLRVKACNGQGVWAEKEAVLQVVIVPPFWRTGWAFILYVLVSAVALYVAFRLVRNFNVLRNRIQVEKQLTEYKLVFFTNISHEFRTPLTLIQGALEKVQRMEKVPKEMNYSLKVMEKSTQRMLRLINQLLEFRKMQNNKLALSLEETDVVAFLYEIFLSFSDAAESKNMDFQFVPSRTSYTMFIDKGHLDKVTYNLLSNAFKYTPSGGKVTFTVDVDEERKKLVITVRDTGVGIPPEKRNELFKRFMQSSFSGSSVGVGLHLSHELVCVHKGTIEFSENEGGGSVFTVTLPTDPSVYEEKDFLIPHNVLLEEERKHQEQVAAARMEADIELPEVEPINKKRVLIIEDDNDVREFLKEEVGRYFEVMAEADGVAGLARAREYDADLIVCDVLMPGMTGFEVTRKLKNDFNTSHIPIILLTAMNSAESHLAGVESGADAYITKPFSPKLLLARAFKLIEQREKLKEKFSNAPNMLRPTICSSDKDKAFADQLQAVVEQQLENAQFTVDEFASIMGLGRTVFYRKVRGVTGYSPNEYIRIVRMKKAAELLLESNYTVSEVSYKVGINDPFYFSKCFKHHFGVSPSAYREGTAAKPGETPAGGGDEA